MRPVAINAGKQVDMILQCSKYKLKEEVSKCDIRCCNCHRRKTAIKNNWYKININVGRQDDR